MILGIPFHPKFTFFWETLSAEEFFALRKWLLASETKVENNIVQEIVGVNDKSIKIVLEKLCIQHQVIFETK